MASLTCKMSSPMNLFIDKDNEYLVFVTGVHLFRNYEVWRYIDHETMALEGRYSEADFYKRFPELND